MGMPSRDATLLVSGLDTLTMGVIAQHTEVQIRVQTFRHQHTIDHIPTQDKAVSLVQMLQAEWGPKFRYCARW